MVEKNTKLYKILFIIGCVVLAVAFSFGLKTMIDYKNDGYNEERPYGAISQCSAGSYIAEGGESCETCPKGYYCSGGYGASKYQCPSGQYQDETGQSSCKTCPSGTVPNTYRTECVSSTTEPTVTISGSSSVQVNKAITLTATASDGAPVSWSSSDTSIATVSGGTVTGKAAGSVTITAESASGAKAEKEITVYAAPTVTISGPSYVYVNKAITLTATASDGAPVSWSSSDTSIATVSGGTVIGKAPGSVTIKVVTQSGAEDTIEIEVATAPVVTVSCESSYMQWRTSGNKCTTKVNGIVVTEGVKYTAVSYSEGTEVLTVSENGVVSAIAPGFWGGIIATYDGVSSEPFKIVTGYVGSISLECDSTTLSVGTTTTCKVIDQDGAFVEYNLSFSSSDANKVSVTNDGVVTGLAPGTSIITAKVELDDGSVKTADANIKVMLCSAGYWRGENSCEKCPAGYYCEDGLTKETCPSGKTSSLGAKSADECYVKEDDSVCEVSVSIASKHVSVDEDGLNENSYYAVKVTVTGNGCNGQKLTYTATNAKSISPSSLSNISSGSTYYFNVYPKEACTSSTAKATLTNGKSASATISTVLTDWKIENGCWTTSQVAGKPIGSHNADNDGVNEYYDNYDDAKQCYTTHAYRYGCGTSNPSTENDACYMNNATGIYVWGKYKNDKNYTLISDKTSSDTCKPSPEGGQGDDVYACYKDANNNYIWAVTPPAGYTLVESIKDEANCKVVDKAACYIDANNKYVWGDYSNNASYKLVESIKTAENCVNPPACYKDKNGNFVWGNYAYNSSYSLIANITNQNDCGDDTVNVPSTAASTAAVVYISVIVMLIAGGSVVYYVYNKKKFS